MRADASRRIALLGLARARAVRLRAGRWSLDQKHDTDTKTLQPELTAGAPSTDQSTGRLTEHHFAFGHLKDMREVCPPAIDRNGNFVSAVPCVRLINPVHSELQKV